MDEELARARAAVRDAVGRMESLLRRGGSDAAHLKHGDCPKCGVNLAIGDRWMVAPSKGPEARAVELLIESRGTALDDFLACNCCGLNRHKDG